MKTGVFDIFQLSDVRTAACGIVKAVLPRYSAMIRGMPTVFTVIDILTLTLEKLQFKL